VGVVGEALDHHGGPRPPAAAPQRLGPGLGSPWEYAHRPLERLPGSHCQWHTG
jgi:hypothetical protein